MPRSPKGWVAAGLAFGLCASSAFAQKLDFQATGKPLKASPPDPKIVAALREVSAEKIRENIQTLVNFGTRNSLSSTVTDLPPGKGIDAAANWIEAQLEGYSRACGGCLEVKTETFTQEPPKAGFNGGALRVTQPTKMTILYAILKGVDPVEAKRMYLVTGHYDTRATNVMDPRVDAPGANDDASGAAVSMECARVLSRHRFPATIVFVTVPGEEQGLLGSKHMAEFSKGRGWDLEGVLNNDIVGGNTTPGDRYQSKGLVRVFSEGIPSFAPNDEIRRLLSIGAESDSPSRELAREVLATSKTYFPASASSGGLGSALRPVMEMRLDRYQRGGDHRSFNEEGFPAVRITEWREDYNHQHQTVRVVDGVQYGDLIQYDDFNYIAKVARLNAATLATMASAPGSAKNVGISVRNQENNSVLTFEEPEGTPADAWYQIVWRETDAPDWQYGGSASLYNERRNDRIHTVTVPMSKDNVFFGVRSCDPQGHCSPAVAPLPVLTPPLGSAK